MTRQNGTIDTLLGHRSVRRYTDRAVEEAVKQTIFDCLQMAPTSSYFQAYSVIEVADGAKRARLSEIAGGQDWVVQAPLVLLFCADLHRNRRLLRVEDEAVFSNTEAYTVAVIDAALAAQKGFIAAQSLGLGGVIVGGIRNDMDALAALFGLPDMVMPLFLLCLGYPAEEPPVKPRLPREAVVMTDGYRENLEGLAAYDDAVSDYFGRYTGSTRDLGWVDRCSHALGQKPRYGVGEFARKAGFLLK